MKSISKMALFVILALLIIPLAHADITTDLRAWYKFENNLRDSSNYNDGIAMNPSGVSYSDGYIGRALHLNNTYSAVNIGNDTSLQIDGNMTFSAWMYPYMDTGGYILSKAVWYGDNGEYDIQYSSPIYDNYLYFGRNLDYKITSCPIVVDSWQLVTMTTNETDTKFYINGSLIFEDTGLIASSNTTGNAWIGNFPPEGAYGLDVLYDEVRLYNRTLSYDDVEELYAYNGTTPTTTTTIPPTTSTTITPITGEITLNNKISYAVCLDNMTLKNAYVFLNENGTFEKNQIIFCDVGCVTTGNATAECQPKPFDIAVMFILVVVALFGALILILSRVRR
jgi:hypothetical protein